MNRPLHQAARWRASVGLRLYLVQDLLNVGGCRFLSVGEVLEGDEELSHDGLRRNHYPELIGIPALEQLCIHRHFKWVLPEINDQRDSPRLGHIGPPRVLGSKGDFPIAVSKRIEATRIV